MMKELPDEAIDIVVEYANRAESPLTSIVIGPWGGALARVDPTATAFAYRNISWDVSIFPQWTDPVESGTHNGWARNLADALKPFSSDGHVISFLDEEPDAVIRASFGPNYDRLRLIKKKYDPGNFFRVCQNIEPAD